LKLLYLISVSLIKDYGTIQQYLVVETKNFVSLKNLELGGNIVVAIDLDNKGFRSDIDVTVAIETLEIFLQILSK
jgi:hypothetical protein